MNKLFTFTLLLLVTISLVSADPLDHEEGLVGYWSFDGRFDPVRDDWGSINAVLSSGARYEPNGKVGGSIRFGGNGEKIWFNNKLNNMDNMERGSISMWVYPMSYNSNKNDSPRFIGRYGDYEYVSVGGEEKDNRFHFHMMKDNTPTELISTTEVLLNQWYHITITWDTSEGTQLFVNGKIEDNSSTGNGWRKSPDLDLNFGAQPWDNFHAFKGLIDEAAIWDRVLTGSEVSDLFQNPENIKSKRIFKFGFNLTTLLLVAIVVIILILIFFKKVLFFFK